MMLSNDSTSVVTDPPSQKVMLVMPVPLASLDWLFFFLRSVAGVPRALTHKLKVLGEVSYMELFCCKCLLPSEACLIEAVSLCLCYALSGVFLVKLFILFPLSGFFCFLHLFLLVAHRP